MGYELRRVRPGEGGRLREIRLRALSEAPGAFGSTFAAESDRPDDDWDRAATARSAGKAEATFVAEVGGNWVGLAGGYRLSDQPGTVRLFSMWVAPETRGLGTGRRLVDAVLVWARAAGARAVDLWVTLDNDTALSLYRRAGFLPTDECRPLPSDPSRQIQRMMLVLNEPG